MRQAQINVRTRACSRTSKNIARTKQAALTHNVRGKELNIENYNSGPNMLTLTSLTFFTAIFVALGGALAVELMIVCRKD